MSAVVVAAVGGGRSVKHAVHEVLSLLFRNVHTEHAHSLASTAVLASGEEVCVCVCVCGEGVGCVERG